MARGRKEKPAALRLAQGNPGRRKIEERTAFVAEAAPAEEFPPPAHLCEEEKLIWREEVRHVGSLNLLRKSDISAFEIYVSALHIWRKAKQVVAKQGASYVSSSKHGDMVRVRPEVMMMNRYERVILNFQREFGMTSVSRIRAHSIVAATRQPGQGDLPLAGGGNGKAAGQDPAVAPAVRGPLGALRAQGHA